jgi:Tol biopolymer transport system component
MAASGGFPQRVTALDDPVGIVRWSPDGQWLALSLAPGGGMNQQVYLIRPDGTELRLLTAGGRDNNWLGFWTHDSRALAIASNRANPEAMDAYLFDVGSGEWRLAARNRGIGSLTDASRDGRHATLYRLENRSNSDLFLLDLASGTEVLLTPHGGSGNFDAARFSPDGRTIYLISDKDREQPAFARVRLDPQGNPGDLEVIAGRDDAQLQEYALTENGNGSAAWNVADAANWFSSISPFKITPSLPPAE